MDPTTTIIISIVISLIAGVVSGYVTHFVIESADKRKWKHVKNELLESQRLLCSQILTSVRFFLGISIPSGFAATEESVFEFLKTEMIDNMQNHDSKIKYPNKTSAEAFIKNISGINSELLLQRDRFLLFKHSKPDYYEDCSSIINLINNILLPFRTFPEIVERKHDGDKVFEAWRIQLKNNLKLLVDDVYEARTRSIRESKK